MLIALSVIVMNVQPSGRSRCTMVEAPGLMNSPQPVADQIKHIEIPKITFYHPFAGI